MKDQKKTKISAWLSCPAHLVTYIKPLVTTKYIYIYMRLKKIETVLANWSGIQFHIHSERESRKIPHANKHEE